MRFLSTMLLCVLLVSVSACAQEEEPKKKETLLNDFAIAIVRDSAASVPPEASFAWAPAMKTFYEDPQLTQFPLQEILQQTIHDTLVEKNLRYQPSPGADFLVGYVVALEKSMDDKTIDALYGVQPGLVVTQGEHEKGTIILDIIDTRQGRSIWRSAGQGVVGFELTDEQRRSRIRQALTMMLRGFPESFR